MLKSQREILERLIERKRIERRQTQTLNIHPLCFPKQLQFITDSSKFVTAVTSRRAGKTTACAIHLLQTAVTFPKTTSFYITYARTDAKGIVWPMLHKLNRELKLNGDPNEADLTWKFPNDSMIRLGGAATAAEIDRFRGYAIKLAYVDESQRFGSYLERLVNDVLVPASLDFRGQIRLIGTPGMVPTGYFFEASRSLEFSNHSWTIFDNPFIENPEQSLNEELQRRGITTEDPTIQREFFGKWVTDKKRLVFDYDILKNHYAELPVGNLEYIMGIDIGYKDADAICILAHSDRSPITFLVDEVITHKQGLTELFMQVEKLRAMYKPYKLVIDTGGLGLKIAESMIQRYQIPVQAAEKSRKFENIELFNDALRSGKFMAKKDSRFVSDAMLVEWDIDKATPDKKCISDRFHSDICLTKDSLILTKRGSIPISQINISDSVLTRHGYQSVEAIACTSKDAEILELEFSNGQKVKTTSAHQFYTMNRGFIAADKLTQDDYFISVQQCIALQNSLTESPFINIQPTNKKLINVITWGIGEIRKSICIKQFGLKRMGKFLKDSIFIIKMQIQRIIVYPILSSFRHANIRLNIGIGIENQDYSNPDKILKRQLPLRQNGIVVRKDANSIDVMRFPGGKKTDLKLEQNALCAPNHIGEIQCLNTQSFIVQEHVAPKQDDYQVKITLKENANIAEVIFLPPDLRNNVSVVGLVAVRKLNNEAVFNMSIANYHEYFANSILVSNCDAILYAFRISPAYSYVPPKELPKHGTREWGRAEEEEMERQTEEHLRNEMLQENPMEFL